MFPAAGGAAPSPCSSGQYQVGFGSTGWETLWPSASFLHGHLGGEVHCGSWALWVKLFSFLSLLAYARKEISEAAKREQQVCWARPLPRGSAPSLPVSFTCWALVSGTCPCGEDVPKLSLLKPFSQATGAFGF